MLEYSKYFSGTGQLNSESKTLIRLRGEDGEGGVKIRNESVLIINISQKSFLSLLFVAPAGR